jgi:uncharacterized protein YceK
MRKITHIVIAVSLVVFLSGCSSIGTQLVPAKHRQSELNHPITINQIYSGTSANVIWAKAVYSEDTKMDDAGRGYEKVIMPVYFLFEIPLSLGMDTVLLPVSGYKQIKYGDLTIE